MGTACRGKSWTVRETLAAAKDNLDLLLDDARPLPDEMPDYIERDFRGRISDLAFIVIRQLMEPGYDQSLFRSLDDKGRNEEIKRLKARGFGEALRKTRASRLTGWRTAPVRSSPSAPSNVPDILPPPPPPPCGTHGPLHHHLPHVI